MTYSARDVAKNQGASSVFSVTDAGYRLAETLFAR